MKLLARLVLTALVALGLVCGLGGGVSTAFAAESSSSSTCKFKLVKSGDKGSCALEAQQDLKKAGYYNGPLDSHFGPQSAAATRQAQIDHGIQPVSANYGELTRAVLKGGATPRAPSDPKAQAPSSPNVATGVGVGFKTKTGMERKVQERLQFHKDPRGRPYYDGKLDGVFGEGSANGLIVFQYAWPGLRVTGTVDQATWDALMSNDQRHVSVGPGSIPQGSGIINSVSQRTSWLVINGQVVEQMDSRGPGLKPDKKTGIWRVHKMVWGKHTVYDKKIKTPSEYFGNEAMPHSLIYHPDSYVHGSALFDRDGYAGASFGCFNLHTWVAERIWPLVPKDKGWVYNKP